MKRQFKPRTETYFWRYNYHGHRSDERAEFQHSPRYLVDISVEETERRPGGDRRRPEERQSGRQSRSLFAQGKGKKRSGEPRALLIDGSLAIFTSLTELRPEARESLLSFSPLSFSFPSTAPVSPRPSPDPSASFPASLPPPVSPLCSRSFDEGEIFRRPREAHVKERKKTWGPGKERRGGGGGRGGIARGAARRPKPH